MRLCIIPALFLLTRELPAGCETFEPIFTLVPSLFAIHKGITCRSIEQWKWLIRNRPP